MASLESKTLRPVVAPDSGIRKPPEVERREWEAAVENVVLPLSILVTPIRAADVPCEWVELGGPQDRGVVLFLHGGGYNSGSCKTHRELAARLASHTKLRVLTVDYRLAPEFPFPAALEDAVAVYRWLLGFGYTAKNIVIGGDSAGGGLAASTLLRLRDDHIDLPAAAFLMSPMLDLTFSGPSVGLRAPLDPVVTLGALQTAAEHYLAGRNPKEPLASPLFADLQGLPPLLLQVGDYEILLDDATRFAERAEAAGVGVRLEVWDEMWHVWQATSGLPEAEDALAHIASFVRGGGVS